MTLGCDIFYDHMPACDHVLKQAYTDLIRWVDNDKARFCSCSGRWEALKDTAFTIVLLVISIVLIGKSIYEAIVNRKGGIHWVVLDALVVTIMIPIALIIILLRDLAAIVHRGLFYKRSAISQLA